MAPSEHRQLRRVGQATRFRTFPVRREKPEGETEFRVYLGFDTQADAEGWIGDALAEGLLREATKAGAPGRPVRRPRYAD